MSIEMGLSKLPHSVGVLCILRREFAWGISADFFLVGGLPAENCPKLSKL